jgi:hypothetical protein
MKNNNTKNKRGHEILQKIMGEVGNENNKE